HEVGIALVLGHHRDGEHVPALVTAGARRAHDQQHQPGTQQAGPIHGRLLRASRPRTPSTEMSRKPTRIPASSTGRSARRRPFCSTAIASTPSAVPWMLPTPPEIDVPPSTTAAMAMSSYELPASALAWPSRAT